MILQCGYVEPIRRQRVRKLLLSRKQRKRIELLSLDPRCKYCGVPLGRTTATLDHVVPKSKGGTLRWGNIVLACHDCNQAKGAELPGHLGVPTISELSGAQDDAHSYR